MEIWAKEQSDNEQAAITPALGRWDLLPGGMGPTGGSASPSTLASQGPDLIASRV